MDPLVIGVAATIVVAALVAWMVWDRRRTAQHLHLRYGSEYDRTVDELGRRRAQAELIGREERVNQLDIRALLPAQRDRFTTRWRDIQTQFVDDPDGAVTQGEHLVEDVMEARGYPVNNFDQRVADLSVYHAQVVENYRAAREIGRRHRRGQATTEDLRQAMVYYRELFEDLLEDRESIAERVVERRVEREEHIVSSVGRPPRRPATDREIRP